MKVLEVQIEQLNRSFKRIFSLPISRMTIRELQDAISAAMQGHQDASKSIYDSLLQGELLEGFNPDIRSDIQSLIDTYSFQARLARDVAEYGEFLNSFTCDFLQQANQVYFINRMRRLDGQEYHFLSAPENNIRLAHMFITRLQELKKAATNGLTLDPRLLDELAKIKATIDSLLG